MNKKSIIEIMEDMDRLEKIEITDELVEILKEHFREDIEQEKREKEALIILKS